MKKNYILGLLMCIGSLMSLSQTITLAPTTATSGNTTASPLNAYYSDIRFQTVYTKAEINAQGVTAASAINSLAFYVEVVPAGGIPNFTISLANTTATNSAAHDATAVTSVYSAAPLNLVVGWNTFTFSTPFIWNGNDNLLVNTCASNMPFTSPYGGIRTYTATSGSRFKRDDGASQCALNTTSTLGTKPHVQLSFVAPPSCLPPTGVTFSNLTSTSANVSWTHGGALVYGFEYGTTGFTLGSGTRDTAMTTMKSLSGLSPNTTYQFYIKALCTLTDSSTLAGPFSFTTPCATASIPYLQNFTSWPPTCWSLAGGTNNWVSLSGMAQANFYSVSTGNYFMTTEPILISSNARLKYDRIMNNYAGSSTDSLYVEIKEGSNPWTIIVARGGASLATLNNGFANTSATDPSITETIILDSATYTNKTIQVRFRAVSGWGSDLLLDNVIIEAVPNCPEPLMLGAHNITATSADVRWSNTAGSANFRLEYGAPGFVLGAGNSSIVTNDTVTLSGLSSFTTYEFYVTSVCTSSDSSPWSGPFSFTTLCNDTNMGPWMDDVEGHGTTTTGTSIANCWSSTNTGSVFDWNITSSGTPSGNTGALTANSGSNFFYTEASGAGASDTAILNTPSINLVSLTTPFLEFYYHMFGNQIGSLSVEVFNGTIWTNELTISGAQQATQASPWNQQYVDLSAYTGIIKLRFVAVSNGTFEGDISLDDISVIESPTCFTPAMAMAVGVLNDTATASWTQQFGTPSKYYVQYGPTGFVPGAGITDSSTTTMYGIGGLMGATTYDYYVRAFCGAGDTSAWVGPVTFTTLCDPLSPTYTQDFASYLPTCWEEANGFLTTSSNVVIGASDWSADGFANVGTTGAASMNIWSSGRNDWLISAPIDLGDGSVPYQVEFDVALTDYASTGTDAMGVDDTLALVISTDFGQTWSSANILRNYVSGDEPSNAGNREFIDLTGYTGIVKFGFYGASSVSNADYDVHIDNFLVTNLCVPSTTSYIDTACGTYTSPSGKIWTMPGTYNDTLQKVRGCDSVLIITLVVNNTTASVSPVICDSYTSPSGMVYTTSGMYMDTIPNSIGCDSIISINLTVNTTNRSTAVLTVCDRYVRPNGMVAVINGTFIDTINTVNGCDSIITTVLTVNYNTSSNITQVACGSYTSPSGKVWVTSGTRFDTIPNSTGCDSTMVINLTIRATSAVTRTVSACGSHTVPETGNVYTTSGTYTDVTTNAFGCPHTITTVLTINTANAGTISANGITLTSSLTGVDYKWMDCDNNYSYLLGETNQSFTPIRNGNYAVEITNGSGCKDTTTCLSIMSVSLEEFVISESDISIYPNPANEMVTVDILRQNNSESVTITLFDAIGKVVFSKEVTSENNKIIFDVSNLENGIYSVSVANEFFNTTKKVTVVK